MSDIPGDDDLVLDDEPGPSPTRPALLPFPGAQCDLPTAVTILDHDLALRCNCFANVG